MFAKPNPCLQILPAAGHGALCTLHRDAKFSKRSTDDPRPLVEWRSHLVEVPSHTGHCNTDDRSPIMDFPQFVVPKLLQIDFDSICNDEAFLSYLANSAQHFLLYMTLKNVGSGHAERE